VKLKIAIAIALVAFVAGICGAIAYGLWGVSQDCRKWVDTNGYRLVHDDWWAKSRGCQARTSAGDDVYHSEALGNKAIGWAWQLAIFVGGALPAAIIVACHTTLGAGGGP
jgi:hypothetical protein